MRAQDLHQELMRDPEYAEAYRRLKIRRFAVRGWTPLGLFNTVTAALFGHVLVVAYDTGTGKIVRCWWDHYSKHPLEESNGK